MVHTISNSRALAPTFFKRDLAGVRTALQP
jgi:hypothetical protein